MFNIKILNVLVILSLFTCIIFSACVGERGRAGIQGIQGEKGDAGEVIYVDCNNTTCIMNQTPNQTAGLAATINVNYTESLPSGSNPYVINIGNSSSALLDFGIPSGSSINEGTMYDYIDSTNSSMKNYVDSTNSSMKNYVDSTNSSMKNYVDSFGIWNTYTPTLTWSGTTPTGSTSSYRYAVINKTVFIAYYITYSDSKGSSLTYATLPINVTSNGAYIYVLNGFEQYGDPFGSLFVLPSPWIYPADAGRLRFLNSMAGTNTKGIRYVITGFYESV